MIASILNLVARLAAIRWALKSLVGLGVLVPIAFVLKFVGLPILAVLGVLAAPVLIILFILGLPIFMVVIVGGLLLGGLFFLMTIGLVAIKFLIFVVLPIWLVWIVAGWVWRMFRPAPATEAGASQAGA